MKRTVKLGEVGVDSGQLILCDPAYLSDWENAGADFHGHTIHRDVKDGSLWQFTYGAEPQAAGVTKFPGTYGDIIPKYGKCPNDLISEGIWKETDIDPRPGVSFQTFSYEAVCKRTSTIDNGQLYYALGHAGRAVAFISGIGDGLYPVYAEISDEEGWGERIAKVWIDFLPHPYFNSEEE